MNTTVSQTVNKTFVVVLLLEQTCRSEFDWPANVVSNIHSNLTSTAILLFQSTVVSWCHFCCVLLLGNGVLTADADTRHNTSSLLHILYL